MAARPSILATLGVHALSLRGGAPHWGDHEAVLYQTVTCGDTFAAFLRAKKGEYATITRAANIKLDK